MSAKTYSTIHCDVEGIRTSSIGVFGDWGSHINIPLSLIEDGELVNEGPDQDLNVETWWCKKEGIE